MPMLMRRRGGDDGAQAEMLFVAKRATCFCINNVWLLKFLNLDVVTANAIVQLEDTRGTGSHGYGCGLPKKTPGSPVVNPTLESAAHVPGLRKFRSTFGSIVQPRLQNSKTCMAVQDGPHGVHGPFPSTFLPLRTGCEPASVGHCPRTKIREKGRDKIEGEIRAREQIVAVPFGTSMHLGFRPVQNWFNKTPGPMNQEPDHRSGPGQSPNLDPKIGPVRSKSGPNHGSEPDCDIANYEPPYESESHLKYAHKTHYRIVFKEKGITIDRIRSLPDVMTVLTETVSALRLLLRKLGWVHCDLTDLEYAKKMGDLKSHEMRTARFSPTEIDEFLGAKRRARRKVPFSHNHLHDLESLWWVAVWMVFYNYFSQRTSSYDHPSFTLRDVERRLRLAQVLFPPMLDSTTRLNGFRHPESFQDTCDQLPGNKRAIYDRDPLSVDPNSSKGDIYNNFTRVFSTLKTVSHDLVLDFIPNIWAKLSKEEHSKRPRSESMNDTGVARKTPRR
ncbi:hypothetical protein V8E52_009406 [Russula decolorans]